MLYHIYIVSNLINNKVYIGRAKDVKKRWGQHRRCVRDTLLTRAIKKYGLENFKFNILYKDLTLEESNVKEIEEINNYQSTKSEKGYNITKGGDGHLGLCGENHPMYGRKREDLSELNRLRKGKKLSEDHKKNIGEGGKGKHHTEESKEKMRLIRKQAWSEGIYDSEEYRQKISKANTKNKYH